MSKLLASWRAAALICAVAATCLPIVARLVTGPPGAVISVRWGASVDAAARQRLETRFRLEDGERVDGPTWQYDLVDPSPEIIRALVRDPAVDDTHHIDRSRFVLDDAERTARRGWFASGGALVAAADGMAVGLAAFAAMLVFVAASRSFLTTDLWARWRGSLFRAEDLVPPYVLLTTLGLAVYAVALRFPPSNDDDMSYLSSVATVDNPLFYFTHDVGSGSRYRPLLPVGMWLVYQMFGVWAMPNQIINLAVHMANVFLVYRIVQRARPDKTIALLVAAVFMVSKYTFLAATWVSDRPMVLTGLFLLLLVNHLSQHEERAGNQSATPVRISVVAALSVLALMSKESGLVVPLVGLVFALVLPGAARLTPSRRLRLSVVTVSIIGLYFVWRMLIFGSDFVSYTQDGYMFLGLVHYERSSDLPQLLRYLNYGENLVKHLVAPVVPVFEEGGALLSLQSLLTYLPVIVSTALLFGLAVRRPPTHVQLIALAIILVNAVVHLSLFRFRLHYLSHAAFCLFVGTSPLWGNRQDPGGRALAVKMLALIAFVGGTLWTSNVLSAYTQNRNQALSVLRTNGIERYGQVVEQVLVRYR